MRLNVSTDYAIRLILYLAKNTKTVSSSKLSSAIGVSPRYLLQIGAKLRDAGLITTAHGPAGGYGLAKPAGDISLRDIIIVMEERIKAKQHEDSETIADSVELKMLDAAYEYVDDVLGDILDSITIENLLTHNIAEWYLAPYLMNPKQSKIGKESGMI